MIIRKLEEKDIDVFFETFSSLVRSEFPEYTTSSHEAMLSQKRMFGKEKYLQHLIKDNRIILGAYIGDKLVGILDGEIPFCGVSLLCWLMVEKKYQRQGIGKALLKYYENTLKRSGGHSIYLYADKRNKELYLKLGYEYVGVHRKSWFGLDHIYFTKLIQDPKEENYLK